MFSFFLCVKKGTEGVEMFRKIHKKMISLACVTAGMLTALLVHAPILTARAAEAESFSYTGDVQKYTAPVTGAYKLEVWGAQGGTSSCDCGSVHSPGGKGGYATGIINLNAGEEIYVVVGGSGNVSGYNGGGESREYKNGNYVYNYGGGATHIGTFDATLKDHGSTDGLYIVAGGGGEGGCNGKGYDGGAGGGLNGVLGERDNLAGEGASQSAGGAGGIGNNKNGSKGSFGKGGDGISGGGGGLYGGGGGGQNREEDEDEDTVKLGGGAGGGSSYVGGVDQAYTVTGVRSGHGKAVITPLNTPNASLQTVTGAESGIYEWVCPRTAYYMLEVWGAQGGNADFDCGSEVAYGGKGGYAYGELHLTKGTVLTITVGKEGEGANVPKAEDDEWMSATADNGEPTAVTAPGIVYIRGEGGKGGYGQCRSNGDDPQDGAYGSFYVNGALINTKGEKGLQEGDGRFVITPIVQSAGGGSNFMYTDTGINHKESVGVREGDGSLVLQSVNLGFFDSLSLDGVAAPDLAAPDAVQTEGINESTGEEAIVMEPVEGSGGTKVKVTWTKPKDNGTDYYHMVTSHTTSTGAQLCTSNITKNTLTTGVYGYYYIVDGEAETEVAVTENSPAVSSNAGGSYSSVESPKPVESADFTAAACSYTYVNITDLPQYLHIAPVDVAGNIGETSHVSIDPLINPIEWFLYTGELTIDDGENVYWGEDDNAYPDMDKKVWYVRADGATPFTLEFDAWMEGIATETYQINQLIFKSQMQECERAESIVEIPMLPIADGMIEAAASGLVFSSDGAPVLQNYPYTKAVRSNFNKDITIVNSFLIDAKAHGKWIHIIPGAAVVSGEHNVHSNAENDSLNGIYIIGDSEAPEIDGMEVLEDMESIDPSEGIFMLELEAEDDVSGVAEFYVEICNDDNGSFVTYESDADGGISINLTEENAVFNGSYTITVTAVDNVGNRRTLSHKITTLALETSVRRILAPHAPVFQRGESGILTVDTWGYVERIEVEFPRELAALNPELGCTYTYDIPSYEQTEELQFMIPVYVPEDGTYSITVRAYKGDRELVDYPEIEIKGTILDDFRTRLR